MIAALIDAFVADVCAGKTNETARSYRSKLSHLIRYLGDSQLPTQQNINHYKTYLLTRDTHYKGKKLVKGPLSKFTVRTVLTTTRHLLHWSYKRGHLPLIELVNIREPTPEPKAISDDTVARMLLAVPRVGPRWVQVRNYALMYCLIDTGARSGSLARLETGDLRLDEGYATVLDKGDQWSWLYFSDATVERLRSWLEMRYTRLPSDDRIFTGYRGTGLTRQGIARTLNALAAAAGVDHYRHNAHSFRHAFARSAILAGASLNQVAEMLNHRGIVVTHKYYARWERGKEVREFHTRYSPGRLLP